MLGQGRQLRSQENDIISRRSALIVFAGAVLSGSVNAQHRVTDGRPKDLSSGMNGVIDKKIYGTGTIGSPDRRERFCLAATLHFNVRPTATQTSPVLPKAGLFFLAVRISIDLQAVPQR